jgi:allophanate hydrolase subunit 1
MSYDNQQMNQKQATASLKKLMKPEEEEEEEENKQIEVV